MVMVMGVAHHKTVWQGAANEVMTMSDFKLIKKYNMTTIVRSTPPLCPCQEFIKKHSIQQTDQDLAPLQNLEHC